MRQLPDQMMKRLLETAGELMSYYWEAHDFYERGRAES
jgi:hypothetical protein